MKRVSILIVSYNSGNYIINTLKSVLSQTYTNLEILILDNNSKDNTIHNIKSFKDKRIKLFQLNKNIGPYKGLNYLLKKSSGEYIAIQDHDDLWYEKKIAIQVNFLEKNKKYIGCGTETIMYYENNKTFFKYFLNKKNYYTIHPSLVFRNKNKFKYNDSLIYLGDAFFQKKILCNNKKKIYNIKIPLTLHIIKGGYRNFTYSWFNFNIKYIKRIFEIHNFSLYSFFFLFYEIFRKILLIFLKIFKSEKIFIFFDRLPYILIGNKIINLDKSEDKYILDFKEKYL